MKTTARINITLPEATLRRIDKMARRGDRSRFIDQAVNYYLKKYARTRLRALLKEGALVRAERDIALAADLFDNDEVWGTRDR